ncbi:hypothetical protein MNB_SV-4-1455 [hydrothermal vent metagenome]|uniref:RNA polymerase sigma-70 domain-containing protein n=1 Tax=hydrothermal vent metagenome TaxID=652676 RepID=A0A1W1E7H9_9ZZZZ
MPKETKVLVDEIYITPAIKEMHLSSESIDEILKSDLSLEEIGMALGVSKERMVQIEKIVLQRLDLQYMRKDEVNRMKD